MCILYTRGVMLRVSGMRKIDRHHCGDLSSTLRLCVRKCKMQSWRLGAGVLACSPSRVMGDKKVMLHNGFWVYGC